VTGSPAALRPLGFLVLMIGLGLRLDTGWQATAWLLMVGGAAALGLGLVRAEPPGARAFVAADEEE
jgi:hypothetical protein